MPVLVAKQPLLEAKLSDATLPQSTEILDVVIVGAGFGGLHMLHEALRAGWSARVVEAAPDVGGAWYWNRYPGARCDVESLVYCYSFSPELDAQWRWTERYAAQPEIQAYLRFASERLGLRPHIQFNTRVLKARFDPASDLWTITTNAQQQFRARYCVMATGPITVPVYPDIDGASEFRGQVFHTADWPKGATAFAGKRVGVIGTGSSGTQLIPIVAEQAERLHVFIRTPNYTVPARNHPLTDADYARWDGARDIVRAAIQRGEMAGAGDVFMDDDLRRSKTVPAESYSEGERRSILERRWALGGAILQGAFSDVMTNEATNAQVARFVGEKIHEAVNDRRTADKLVPKNLVLGTKRLCVGTRYYETFNRPNVDIVDVRAEPIARLCPSGVVVGARTVEVDALIYATGFDALTGALSAIEIVGAGGQRLDEAWRDGPQTFLGLGVAGFPNLFMVGGPGSPSVLSNVVVTNEYQVCFIRDLIKEARARGATRVGVSTERQHAWTAHVDAAAQRTLLAKAQSWYVGANVPGKPRAILAYAGGFAGYRTKLEEVRGQAFGDFTFDKLPGSGDFKGEHRADEAA
jgi:cyclohexanone monooxygenase